MRLTARTENGCAYLVNVKPDEQEVDSPYKNTLQCILDCFERLAAYEDAEAEGWLVVLKKASARAYIDPDLVAEKEEVCSSLQSQDDCQD